MNESLDDFKLFSDFYHGNKILQLKEVMDVVINLLQNSSSFLNSGLSFFRDLFIEYCQQYCLIKASNLDYRSNIENPIILKKFMTVLNQDINDLDKVHELLLSIDIELNKVYQVLIELGKNNILISDWAFNLVVELCFKFYSFIDDYLSDDIKMLNLKHLLIEIKKYWEKCSVIEILLNIITNFIDNFNISSFVKTILQSAPNTDCIFEMLYSKLEREKFVCFIDELFKLTSDSAQNILEHFALFCPEVFLGCKKNYCLLKLCYKFSNLRELLASEIVKNGKF